MESVVALFLFYFSSVAVAGPVITVKKNSTVSLHCSIAETINSTSMTPRIDWYKWSLNNDGNSIPVLTNYRPINTTLDQNYNITANGDLVIDSSSSGYYYCKKEASPTNIVLSCPAVLINPPGPQSPFVANPSNKTSFVSLTVAMTCSPPSPSLSLLSSSSSSIDWMKDNTLINVTSSPIKHYISDKGTLYIFSPNVMDDTGAYQCISTDNENGLVYKSTIALLTITNDFLYFSMVQRFQVKPTNVTVLKGQSVQLECLTNGYGQSWSRPGHASLPPSSSLYPLAGILEFNTTTVEDEGVYRCTGRGSGVLYEDVYLRVIEKPNVTLSVNPSLPPSGSFLTISCSSQSSHTGPLNVTLIVGGAVHRSPAHNNGLFTREMFMNYTEGDSISIQCIMTNEYNYCDEASILINITKSVTPSSSSLKGHSTTVDLHLPSSTPSSTPTPTPSPTPSPPVSVSVSPQSVSINIGDSARLTCLIMIMSGHSIAVSGWLPSNIPTTKIVMSAFHMLTATVNESGNYTCVAYDTFFNKYSSVSQVRIVPLTVTVPVERVSVNERENVTFTCLFNYKQSLLVLWRKDNNILYNGVYNEPTPNGTVSVLMLSSVDVTASGVYYCTAINNGHNATASITLNVNILPPSHPPLHVKAEWMPSLRLLVISWAPPLSNDTVLLGYKINWDRVTTYHQTLSQTARGSVSPTTYFFTINNLVAKETYLISVWAYGLGGDGPSVNLRKYLPESQLPSPTGSSSVTVTTATPSPSVAPVASFELFCMRITSMMGGVRFIVSDVSNIHHFSINRTCSLIGRHSNHDTSTIINNLFVPLFDLTSGHCHVTVSAVSVGAGTVVSQRSCEIGSIYEDVHISFGLQWLNGTVLKLSWSISPLLSAIIKDDTAFVVEWRKRNNKTLPLSSSSSSSSWSSSDVLWSITEHKVGDIVDVRVRIGSNVIHTSVLTPPSPPTATATPTITPQSPTETDGLSSNHGDLWLKYGIGIVLLVMVCCILLFIIIILKYIQNNRREMNKITDHRNMKTKSHPTTLSFSDSKRPISIVSYDSLKKPYPSPSPPPSSSSLSSSTNLYSEKRIMNIKRIDTDV